MTLRRFTAFSLCSAALLALAPTPALAQKPARRAARPVAAPPPIGIPYQKFVLPNGLTLIVHEDHKAPIAAVNIWYHVGSKNERPGRTGFAHLFEHLMFNGSEPCLCGWNQTACAISSAPSTRRGSTSSGASSRTRSGRARTNPTARSTS